jgi:low affinity Fe/Cu permease
MSTAVKTAPRKRDTNAPTLVGDAHHAAREAVERVHGASISSGFSRFANKVAATTGKPITFVMAVSVIIVWAVTGPIFQFSDTWQLVINTGTTIVTFLMVFLIQNTQNRDGAALQAKLDELIRATQDARDTYMGIEKLTDEEVERLRTDCSPARITRKRSVR